MKRGASGLSLVVGVRKPVGMSSHDVVNAVRRIFQEKRVGHMGTLDPLASGVLPICVGPATRLDAYLTNHEKRYRVRIAFGRETTTDDAEGQTVAEAPVPAHFADEAFASAAVSALVGEHKQVPPAYSAIKVNGQTAYKLARAGKDVQLEARTISIFNARLEGVGENPESAQIYWDVDLDVSKGTYIRSVARDLGRELGCPAHVAALERTQAGRIVLDECVSLDTLESLKVQAALDPVRVLGVRFCFADDDNKTLENGGALPADAVQLYEPLKPAPEDEACACSTSIERSCTPPRDGELVAVVQKNRLKALYTYKDARANYVPACVFSEGILRG